MLLPHPLLEDLLDVFINRETVQSPLLLPAAES